MSGEVVWPRVLGFGNPLLDITVDVNEAFLARYGLSPNAAILAGPTHMPLYEEVGAMTSKKLTTGGSCLNTMRAVQWMTQKKHMTGFVGSIGVDIPNSKSLQDLVVNCGVKPLFMTAEKAPTGTCAALICGTNRSLVTNLGAADLFTHWHFESDLVQQHIANAVAFYAEGFFVTVASHTLVELGKIALKTNKPFMFNLSAVFLLQVPVFWNGMKQVLPYVDVLFCNETEAGALSNQMGWGTISIEEMAKRIAGMEKANTKRERMVIITQGPDPTVVFHGGRVNVFPTPVVPKADIVDTNGAGDCFVGGFISKFIGAWPRPTTYQPSLNECVRSGQYCAMHCLTNVGCSFCGLPKQHTGLQPVMKALAFATEKHKNQKRLASGEPYISHPVGVANVLTEAGVEDPTVLMAAFLHDTVEDTGTTPEEIEAEFGPAVREIVMEVTDNKSLPKRKRKELQIEHALHISNSAKLIKLADKIHNLESLAQCSPWPADIMRGYFIWGFMVAQGLFGINSRLDARARAVFVNTRLPPAHVEPVMPSLVPAELQPHLIQYLEAMDRIEAAKATTATKH
ncbi:adenosine kinase 2 [Pelomyxa schiedti]|nr:adenosine kinase 2 [Pelomyxa schiedti]